MADTSSGIISTLASGLLALSMVAGSFEPADAKGHGHRGAKKHAHHGGHHGKPHRPNHRPGKPGHRPGGGGNHGGHHHHHNNDRWHHDGHYDHYGRWVAGAWAGAATAAVIGSIAYSLPPACRTIISGGVKYWECGGIYYQAVNQGPNVVYKVVQAP